MIRCTLLLVFATAAVAQETPPAAPAGVAAVGDQIPAPVAPGTLLDVPALTPVYLQLDEEMSSKTNKPGDHFHLSLAEDVRIGNAVVMPAGSAGEGEVIHAARSGGGGKPGELILAARFVKVGDQEVRLRSFMVGARGKDHTDEALAAGIFAGPFAMFVHGGQLVFPRGTTASAKTATDIQLPARDSSSPAAEPQPVDTTNEEEEKHESKTD